MYESTIYIIMFCLFFKFYLGDLCCKTQKALLMSLHQINVLCLNYLKATKYCIFSSSGCSFSNYNVFINMQMEVSLYISVVFETPHLVIFPLSPLPVSLLSTLTECKVLLNVSCLLLKVLCKRKGVCFIITRLTFAFAKSISEP